MSAYNVPRVEALFLGYGWEIVRGSRYLGGFVGSEAAQTWRIEKKVDG